MSEPQRSVHGPEFQRAVLRLMMTEETFCARAVHFLEESYFSGELKWFFRKFKGYHDDFKKCPTDEYVRHEILKHRDAGEAQKYEEQRGAISISKPDDSYLRKELTGFIRANMFIGAYRGAQSLYNAGSKDDAYDFTRLRLEELQKVDFEKEKVVRFGDADQTLDNSRLQFENACPTGIRVIDESMGGMLPQTWTTFLGSSSAGKSMICPNLAFFNAMVGKRTFVTIHEDEEGPTKLRYLACFSGIKYNRLLVPRSMLTDDERTQIRLADDLLKEYVVLRFMYGQEAYVENVQDAIRQFIKEWPFQLYICDYGQCLGSKQFKNRDNKYDIQGFIYEQLKQTMLELNIAGAGGAQVNRTGHNLNKRGTDFLRGTDIGDSFEIFRKSSNVISINRSDEDAIFNRVVFLLDKARSGRAPIAVECQSDYTMCRTHLDGHTQREIPATGAGRRGEGDDKEA
jgi:hypothetical protein